MASDKPIDHNFDWGNTVQIKQVAPECYKPGSKGCICGIRVIDTVETSKQFDQKIGSELYLIEFGDGETLEIPKNFISHPCPF